MEVITMDSNTMDSNQQNDTIIVITSETGVVRGGIASKLKIEDLAVNVNVFLEQVSNVISKSPTQLGNFQFVEFEVHAEVTAKGMLALLGTGGEAGAKGGLKFVFRRAPSLD
jgi:hypothetical protein